MSEAFFSINLLKAFKKFVLASGSPQDVTA
jgi:hypothetical protein